MGKKKAPESVTVRRPGGQIDAPQRMRELKTALDALGIPPGGEFIVMRAEYQLGLGLDGGTAPRANDDDDLDITTNGNRLGPFVRDSETSRKAALANYPRSGTQRQSLLEAIIASGQHGMTREEAAEFLGMTPDSVRPRTVELVEGGWIHESDKTRLTAHGQEAAVLVATKKALVEAP